ncbi:MAG TPA: DegT/DnrJ/EryC1/StrS family aminotransferase [Polyangia bacterium]|jgi:dTDP-4-amino-4,6-dideoxygalactose transaminase|nr:DegT/DnrJ/EryC1/StrS family aminotransferase [Polyangia bacterium]
MRVPLLDLRAQYAQLGLDIEAAVRRVLHSGHYILGEDVAAFERELATATGRAQAVALSSGSDSLLVSLMALGVGPGDEVVTTALSFFATAGAIARLGAKPVFADVEPHSFNIDAKAALSLVTAKTKAIVPVHLFGRACDMATLRRAERPIVEDAAQAIGLKTLGVGSACATLSFFPSKNLGAAGDGGAIVTDDVAFAERVRVMRQHGSKPKYVHAIIGGNFRIDTLQAAILRVKLPHLDAWNALRRRNANHYRAALAGLPLVAPEDAPNQIDHVWHHFVIRVPDGKRDKLREHLKAREIDSEVYYPMPLHLQPCFTELGYRPGSLPEAERACAEALALPVHPDLSTEQLDHVVAATREYFS